MLGRPDVWSGLVLGGLAIFAWIWARDLPVGSLGQPGPGFFPKGLAALVELLALGILGRGILRPVEGVASLWPDHRGLGRVGTMVAALMGYVLGIDRLGYLVTTMALFVVMLRCVGGRSWIVTLVTAVLAAGGSYLLFAHWLMVPLPSGTWIP
jgi:putative tricarboxylic transport membrane protein